MTLIARSGDDFESLFKYFQHQLIHCEVVATGEWQSQDIRDKPMLATHEMTNVSFDMALPNSAKQLAEITGAHLPWAEDHFQERVGGKPLNPAPSEEWWPFAQKVNREHKSEDGGKFSHTYPERMWPKVANGGRDWWGQDDFPEEPMSHMGIRFEYGDLQDVVNQLARGPLTRQAFLPIWFPEDTGAVHGKRVPCTLGYHFMIRNNTLQITYYMRSCDLIRHFQDDVYMAGRLAQWVVNKLNDDLLERRHEYEGWRPMYDVGHLIMHIVSLHCFAGDIPMMTYRDKKGLAWNV